MFKNKVYLLKLSHWKILCYILPEFFFVHTCCSYMYAPCIHICTHQDLFKQTRKHAITCCFTACFYYLKIMQLSYVKKYKFVIIFNGSLVLEYRNLFTHGSLSSFTFFIAISNVTMKSLGITASKNNHFFRINSEK